MSDILKVPGATIVSSINQWIPGELPNAKKFQNLFAAFEASFAVISQVLGPFLDTNSLVKSKDRIISTSSYYKTMSDEDRVNFIETLSNQILNTFNLSRVIGPHIALNPQYLPGSSHPKASQGLGYPLATDRKIQQLPFPPQADYSVTISGDTGWSKAADKIGAMESTAKKYFIDETGTLYSSRKFAENAYIKYDLYIPNTYSYLGAGYNCIPDISILSLEEEARIDALDGDYGLVKITHYTSNADSSTWRVTFPKVISVKDPLLSQASKQIPYDQFEPVGRWETTTSAKWYTLEDSDFYTESFVDKNLLSLFNKETGETFILNWQLDPDAVETVKRTYLVTGPPNLTTKFYQNDHTTLLSSGGSNSRDFFVFAINSTITEQLAQVSLNFSKHKHDGLDSYKVSHNDLLDAQGNIQSFGLQDGTDGGLDFVSFNRQLAYSNVPDNVHPQYMNRLGFLYGGSHGLYENAENLEKLLDLNAMHGDLLFYPITNATNLDSFQYDSYIYNNVIDYLSALGEDAITEKIKWDLAIKNPDELGAQYDFSLYFPYRRSHALIFGYPALGSAEKYTQGATKFYYEPWNFVNETEVDNRGSLWSLGRHGFIPGDNTAESTSTAARRGLNIGWGNIFFGYREDIFGGRLTPGGNDKTEASAHWRTSEFNIITTSNGNAGNNFNSSIKRNYSYRDGFALRAIRGSNVWISAGAQSEKANLGSKSTNGKASVIALEASNPAWYDEDYSGEGGLKTSIFLEDKLSSGSGVFLAPSLNDDKTIPWAHVADSTNYLVNALWNTNAASIHAADSSDGSILDIFSLAKDCNVNPDLNIAISATLDTTLTAWTIGRPYIRGTYGINFCLSGDTVDLDADFATGYTLKDASGNWGPDNVVLTKGFVGGTKGYIFREFRFWGSQLSNISESSDNLVNTKGGNINLLYNYGRDYKRHGLNLTWGDKSYTGAKGGWSTARSISMGSSKPEAYGSSIRQASFVEAFQGLRTDPLQPFIADYVLPILIRIPIDSGTPGTILHNKNIVITDADIDFKESYFEGVSNYTPVKLEGRYSRNPAANVYDQPIWVYQSITKNGHAALGIDATVRGAEEIFLENFGTLEGEEYKYPFGFGFPQSLVSYDLILENYVTTDGDSAGHDLEPNYPVTAYNYNKIKENPAPVYMVNAGNVDITIGDNNLFPVITGGKGNVGLTTNDYVINPNRVIGYNSFLTFIPCESGSAAPGSKYPIFNSKYSGKSDNIFAVILNIPITANPTATNFIMPYRVYKVEAPGDTVEIAPEDTGTGYAVEIKGVIHFKFMRSTKYNF